MRTTTMKCAFLLLVTLLAAFALAGLLSDTGADALSIGDAEASSTPLPVASQSAYAAYDDHSDDDLPYPSVAEALAKFANVTGPDAYSPFPSNASYWGERFPNASTYDFADGKNGPDLSGRYAVDLRIGKDQTHVGTLASGRLYHQILKGLNCTGLAYRVDLPSSPGLCRYKRPECHENCKIKNIVYDSGIDFGNGHTTYESDSEVNVKMVWSYFRIHQKDADNRTKAEYRKMEELRNATFSLIASIYSRMADTDENCSFAYFPGSRKTRMCSVASRLLLAYPTNGGPIEVLVNVELDWSLNMKLSSNQFHCDETLVDLDAIMWGEEGKQMISEYSGWDKDKILPFSFCADKDCFAEGHNMDEAWHEVKKCNSVSDWPIGCDPNDSGPDNPELHCPPKAG